MDWHLGIDIGSMNCKGVLLSSDGRTFYRMQPSGMDYTASARAVMNSLLVMAAVGRDEVETVVATGVGAQRFDGAHATIGDMVSAARGVGVINPEVKTLIDVGSQSSRVIWLDDNGRITDFSSNEKCATGSGRFLQVVANVLRLEIGKIGPLSLQSDNPVKFTTGCAVFGESEAITRVSQGVAPKDILSGVHLALAEKIASLTRSRGIHGRCAVCGGGALDAGLTHHLQNTLHTELVTLDDPQFVNAYGAAHHGLTHGAGLMEQRQPA